MPTSDLTYSQEPQRSVRARKILASIQHFNSLSEEVQIDIVRAVRRHQFKADQVIFLEGEPATALYILETGWVKSIRMSQEGREQAIMFMKPGEIFGDVAVLTNSPYPGTVIALETVTVWAIEQEMVWRLIAQHHELAVAVIRHLGKRILHFVGMIEDLSLRSVEARLAHTLLIHAQISEGQLIVPRRPWTTIDEMATRLGTVRDVLGRTLRAMEEQGVLQIKRDAIIISDPEKLSALGEI